MKQRHPSDWIIVTVGLLPLFCAADRVWNAVFLGVSTLLAVSVFHLIFFPFRTFWLRSLRSLLALVVLSTVLTCIFLTSQFVFPEEASALSGAFPLTFISAFWLAQATMHAVPGTADARFTEPGTVVPGTVSSHLRLWAMFLLLLILISLVRQSHEAVSRFIPLPFWILGAVIAFLTFLNRKSGAK